VQGILDRGLDPEQVLNPHSFQMADMPPDAVQSEAFRRIAENLAEECEHDYICPLCGEHHHEYKDEHGRTWSSETLLYACIQEHIFDFYAMKPFEQHPEHIERKIAATPPEAQNMTREILAPYAKKEKSWWEK